MGTHKVLGHLRPDRVREGQFVRHGYLRSTPGYLHGTHKVLKGYLDTCGPIVFASDRGVSVGIHLSNNDVKSDFLVAPRGTPDRLSVV